MADNTVKKSKSQEDRWVYAGHKPNLETGAEHFDSLHRDAHGTVLVWERLKEDKRWTKLAPNDPTIPSFLNGLGGKKDTYLSVNEFDGWRLVRLLRSLRAFYVDLDTRHSLLSVFDLLEEQHLPSFSLVVFSGNGMHLYWLIDPVPPKALPVWQRVQNALCDAFAPLGADVRARDCTRLLRLVGTVNSKNGETVRGLLLEKGRGWSLRSMAHEVLDFRGSYPKAKVLDYQAQAAKRGRSTPRQITGSIYSWWYKVYQDLLFLARSYGQIPEGHRDEWLFLSAVALSWFTTADALADEIEDAAKTFTSGLQESEVTKVVKLIQKRAEAAQKGEKVIWEGRQVDPRYHFRRASLYKRLAGIIPDTMLPQLSAIIPDRLAAQRKKERDQDRFEDHYTGEGVRVSNEDKRASARLMRARGCSQREIAKELGVSKTTVFKWLR